MENLLKQNDQKKKRKKEKQYQICKYTPGSAFDCKILSPSAMNGIKSRKSTGVIIRLKIVAEGTLSLKSAHSARQRTVVVPRLSKSEFESNQTAGAENKPGSGKMPVRMPTVIENDNSSGEMD